MNGITHKQAKRHMRADLDGLLNTHQRLDLHTHLRECDACRAESESLASLTARLQSRFHNRWDKQNGPSTNVMANVHSQTRRIMLTRRINTGLRAIGGVAALLVLMLAINSIISQVKNISVATNGTQSTEDGTPVFSSQTDNRLIAFTSVKDGNYDIYTMHADGSGLTNLTNSPAQEVSPFWSPDGRRIAFVSGRAGSFGQIYLMDADGSDVVQLTHDQANHEFNRYYGASSGPWSPDGSRLIFSLWLPGEEKWTLYTMDINGENKTPLVSEPNIYYAISWSPDSRRIAFIADDPQSLGGDRIYVVNTDGSNLREITESLQQNEQLSRPDYLWSPDGESIFFISFAQKTNPIWMAYEARLADNSLIQQATTNSTLYYWQNSISVVGEFSIESPIKWSRSDETNSTLHPYENCQLKDGGLSGPYLQRSSNGNWAINAYCPNGDFWFYYANSDGTMIKQLLNSALSAKDSDLTDILWSPDDKFIAFNMASADQSDLYILDVSEALKDPSIQPVKMTNSYGASWQPIVHNDIVEEEPTQTDKRLLAFTSNKDGNLDIYTMHADGSDLTNLTNHPAQDVSPIWSPDGKHIAFESNRDGFIQIYLMNADGSNVTQVTDNEANHSIGGQFNDGLSLWSPDGNKLIFTEQAPGEEKRMLYTADIDGKNKIPITKVPDIYSVPSWSPDGEHIAFIVYEPQESLPENRALSRIYVVDTNGNNLRNITNLLPLDEDIMDWSYFWSSDGQSIFFIADRYIWENNSKSTFYEASLDGNSLVEIDHAGTHIVDQWEDTSFIQAMASTQPLTWLRSDGTHSVLNAYENCEASDARYGPRYKRASNGDLIIGAGCANNDWWFYWANPDGTLIQQILNSPVSYIDGNVDSMAWSPDDRFIAFNMISSDKSAMYILNVSEALKDPSIQPVQIVVGGGDMYYIPSWQPNP
jgi:Tol biopolymer transport system component